MRRSGRRLRPAILQLAAVSFVVNVLALATPLFMMVVVNTDRPWSVDRRGLGNGTVLCAGLLAVYGSTSDCASCAAGCRRGLARASTR